MADMVDRLHRTAITLLEEDYDGLEIMDALTSLLGHWFLIEVSRGTLKNTPESLATLHRRLDELIRCHQTHILEN